LLQNITWLTELVLQLNCNEQCSRLDFEEHTFRYQRKSAEEAESVYQQILKRCALAALTFGTTCDHKIEKKVAIRASEISGLQMSQKDGTSAAGGEPQASSRFLPNEPKTWCADGGTCRSGAEFILWMA